MLHDALLIRLNTWLKTDIKKQKVVIIYGPTACGKTRVSIEIAKQCKGYVIGADSRQIYRWLDIGTGKITTTEMAEVHHEMINIRNLNEEFSVGEYQNLVKNIIHKNWDIPVICWGTGLYLDSIIFHRKYVSIAPDWEYREKLDKFRKQNGNQALLDLLIKKDPEYAKTLHPNNYRYVIRALEVYKKTGVSKQTCFETQKNALHETYDFFFYSPYQDELFFPWKEEEKREKLYHIINTRVDQMFKKWLVKEVKYLIHTYSKTPSLQKTIWYAGVCEYLEKKIDLQTCISQTKQHNRNYAKRQCTWFRKYKEF